MTSFNENKFVARIQNRRGNRINLPQPLEPGEIGWCLDTKQLFIGINPENAIPAIEVFPGAGYQAAAQSIIDTKIAEFSTPYIRLDTSTTTNMLGTTSEEDLLNELGRLPSSAFILKRDHINNLESSIGFMNNINATIASVNNSYNFPYNHLYDWTKYTNITATVTVPMSPPGEFQTGPHVPTNIGLGYSRAPTLTFNGGGNGAAGTATVNGGAVLRATVTTGGEDYSTGSQSTSPILPCTGSGLVVNIDSVDMDGAIIDITITTQGTGYTVGDVVNINGTTGTLAQLTITETTYGSVTGINISSGGSGYNTSPTVTIDPPLSVTGWSTNSYKFTYHLGFGKRQNGVEIDDLEFDAVCTSIMNNSFYITGASELGSNPVGLTGKLMAFVDGSLMMPTPRQAGNVSGLINFISGVDGYSGLTNTRQNVEILTELSELDLNDLFISNPLSYDLAPSATFIQVENDIGSPYTTLPLQYSSTINDVQNLQYSIFADEGAANSKMLRTGTLRVITVDGSTDIAMVDDDYVENRGAGITPVSSSGPDFDFSATFNDVTKIIEIHYRHGFTNNVILKFTTRRWNSF